MAYTTPKESYSKKAALISHSKATPDPRKLGEIQKSNKEKPTTNPDLPTLGKRFWSFIKSVKKDNAGICCWFWNVISFRYPLLVHERDYGSYYKSIITYINDDFYW